MRKYLLIPVIAFLTISLASAKSGDDIFSNDIVHEIRVTFFQNDFWQQMSDNYDLIFDANGLPLGPKIYLPAIVEIDGNVMDTVGVRQKGFFSNWGVWGSDKKPMKIDFNEFISGQKYDGLKKINLANGFEDPSMMRDLLAYDVFRKNGIKAPRASYAKVYLNNTYWGLYIIIEQVDKTFLENNFSDGSGNLYKCIGNSELDYQGPSSGPYLDEFELKTNEDEDDWTDFIRFVTTLNKVNLSDAAYKDSIQSIFNVDQYLEVLAIDVTLKNWDSYYDHGRNFYFYHNPKEDQFYWIPWDYNLSWSSTTPSSLTEPVPGKPLIENLFDVPEFEDAYYDKYCEILAYNFEIDRLDPIITDLGDLILPAYTSSNSEFFPVNDHITSLTSDVSGTFGFTPGLRNFINGQTAWLTARLNQANHTCNLVSTLNVPYQGVVINEFMASNDVPSGITDAAGESDDWIEFFNNGTQVVNLKGYWLSDDLLDPNKWEMPEINLIPGSYLIVWADHDLEQSSGGLSNEYHAGFKLSTLGESIYLFDPEHRLIDSVHFDVQFTNESYSRIPNGTGPFTRTVIPSFQQFNELLSTVNNPVVESISLRPNPASTYVEIAYESLDQSAKRIILTDLSGATVKEQALEDSRMDLDLPSGAYIVMILGEEGILAREKLVVVK